MALATSDLKSFLLPEHAEVKRQSLFFGKRCLCKFVFCFGLITNLPYKDPQLTIWELPTTSKNTRAIYL